MKYAVWFVRLLFAAWMIPAGVNHFYQIFPQPMGSQPLSQELIHALIDSNLFDLVKAVELIAGIFVLIGFYTPLALVVCLPVSFCVFYWDAPLEGWGSRAAQFGYATLASNVLLCLAYIRNYFTMLAPRAQTTAQWHKPVLAGRIIFGAWMLLNGANYLFLTLWPISVGQEALAMQLMTALVNSRLLDVAMALQLVAGILILANILVPLALCVLMPIAACALFWSLFLDQQLLNMALALAAFALNGLLMLAYLPSYKGVLNRYALALGEQDSPDGNFDGLFVSPNGRTSQAAFIPALIVVLLAIGFFWYMVTGRTAHFCMLVLMYPLFILLTRRLQDMGYSSLLLLAAIAPTLAAFAIQLGYLDLNDAVDANMRWVAVAVTGAIALWGSAGAARSK